MIRFNDTFKTRYEQCALLGFYVESKHQLVLLCASNKEYELLYANTETMNKDIELLDKVLYTTDMEEVVSNHSEKAINGCEGDC